MRILFYLFLLIFLNGCAAKFKASVPSQYPYQAPVTKGSIEYALMFDVFKYTGNPKIARSESKKEVEVVAVKITNNSDSSLSLNENSIRFTSGGLEILYVDTDYYYRRVRKSPALYLLWLIATPMWDDYGHPQGQYIDGKGNTVVEPTTLVFPIGLPFAIVNVVKSYKANKQFKKHLVDNSLFSKNIKPHETVYGYIYVRKGIDRNFQLE